MSRMRSILSKPYDIISTRIILSLYQSLLFTTYCGLLKYIMSSLCIKVCLSVSLSNLNKYLKQAEPECLISPVMFDLELLCFLQPKTDKNQGHLDFFVLETSQIYWLFKIYTFWNRLSEFQLFKSFNLWGKNCLW